MAKLFDIMLMDVPQEDGEMGDEEHVSVALVDEITRDGVPYHRTKERLKLDGKSFTVYRRKDA